MSFRQTLVAEDLSAPRRQLNEVSVQPRTRLVRPPPPRKFKPAGRVIVGEFLRSVPSFVSSKKKKRKRGAVAAGMVFEKHGHQLFNDLYQELYVPAPWIKFRNTANPRLMRLCQPDGLIVDVRRNTLTIIEFKLRHTSDSWFQLRLLYYPIIRRMFGQAWHIRILEVAKYPNPEVIIPENAALIREIAQCTPEYNYTFLHFLQGGCNA